MKVMVISVIGWLLFGYGGLLVEIDVLVLCGVYGGCGLYLLGGYEELVGGDYY